MYIPEYREHIHYFKPMEDAVLGACLLEKMAFSRVRGLLTKDCFYSVSNQLVWTIMNEMWSESYPIDILTVSQKIARDERILEMESASVYYYITRLTNSVVSTANLEAHALSVRQMYVERELFRIKFSPIEDTQDALEHTKKMQDELFKLTQIKVTNDWRDMIDGVTGLYKHMDEVKDKDLIGVPTGFSRVDLITGGLCKTQMIVLAARPSVGKSALLNGLVLNAAESGFNVGIISLEMPEVQVMARMGAIVSDIDFFKIFRNRINDDNERDKMYSDFERLSNLPIRISDKTGVSITDIKAKAAQLLYRGQLDILFIDYLQLVEGDGNRNYNREQEVAKMSRGIKLMAMEFNIPVVVLAQLNRESAKQGDKKPQIHHLRESGSIEQDADVVMLLHRDWKSGIQQNVDGSSTEYEADLILAKTRNGETPEIKIGFNPSKMKFYDLEGNQNKGYGGNDFNNRMPYKDDPF